MKTILGMMIVFVFVIVVVVRYRLQKARQKKKRKKPEEVLLIQKDYIADIPLKRTRKHRKSWGIIGAGLILCMMLGAGVYYRSREAGIPESLREFGEKYPEAEAFVLDYPKECKKKHMIQLGPEMQEGGIPLFIQWDKRWGYENYGDDFLGVVGCGPTCMSMVVCGLTGTDTWNPLTVARFSEESGYYVPGQGTSWELMTSGAENLGIHAEQGVISEDYIFHNLSPQSPMICSVYPGDFTYSGHFIVLTDVNENGEIRVNDSNSRNNSSQLWDMEVLLPQIRNIWMYRNL